MLPWIEEMPPDVLGVAAVGKVTHEDYKDILIPKAEAMMAEGSIKALDVIGPEFTGYELEALWDDGAFGAKNWRDFRRVAVVADHGWVRGLMTMFQSLMPCELRLFPLADWAAAKAWIVSEQAPRAGRRRERALLDVPPKRTRPYRDRTLGDRVPSNVFRLTGYGLSLFVPTLFACEGLQEIFFHRNSN